MDVPPRECAVRGQKLLRANLIGPGDGPVVQDPDAIAIRFDTLRRQADPSPVAAGTTIQWEFTDSEAWHIVLNPAGCTAARGPAADDAPRAPAPAWQSAGAVGAAKVRA
jgi:hypothetical protein